VIFLDSRFEECFKMKIAKTISHSFGIVTVGAMLTACSGGSPPSGAVFAPGSAINISHLFLSVEAPLVHTDHHKSWVSPDVRRAPRLLFVSDIATNDVYILTMPEVVLKGTLTGFNYPQGMCADARGNIWIANTTKSQILQYSRTGTLIKTLSDPFGFPAGCSINSATGDLAVTDAVDFNSAQGDVLVYSGGSGSPTRYTCPGIFTYYFDGYGPGGVLWVDGQNTSLGFVLCGGTPSGLTQIPITGGTIYYPGMVQWDNANATWYVGDQKCGNASVSCIYPVSGSGTLGPAINLSGSTGGSICDLVQGTVGASGFKFIVGGDENPSLCGSASPAEYRWSFPAGGSPTNTSAGVVTTPVGTAISTK